MGTTAGSFGQVMTPTQGFTYILQFEGCALRHLTDMGPFKGAGAHIICQSFAVAGLDEEVIVDSRMLKIVTDCCMGIN